MPEGKKSHDRQLDRKPINSLTSLSVNSEPWPWSQQPGLHCTNTIEHFNQGIQPWQFG
jgi:hypothetical protein